MWVSFHIHTPGRQKPYGMAEPDTRGKRNA